MDRIEQKEQAAYTISFTRDEITIIRKAIFAQGKDCASESEELNQLGLIYKKLLEATASDDVARHMQEEGDKYGHD